MSNAFVYTNYVCRCRPGSRVCAMGNSMDGDGCCGEREEGKSENKPAFPGPKDGDTSPRLDAPEAAQRKV